MLRTVRGYSLAGALAGLIAGRAGARTAILTVALTAGRQRDGEMTDFEFRVGQVTMYGATFLLLSGACAGVSRGIAWLAVRHWLRPL